MTADEIVDESKLRFADESIFGCQQQRVGKAHARSLKRVDAAADEASWSMDDVPGVAVHAAVAEFCVSGYDVETCGRSALAHGFNGFFHFRKDNNFLPGDNS